MYGCEFNVVFMIYEVIVEDGILIFWDVLYKLVYKMYESCVVEWGVCKFFKNMYGIVDKYKVFLDIGEVICDDGIFMCFGIFDKNLGFVE